MQNSGLFSVPTLCFFIEPCYYKSVIAYFKTVNNTINNFPRWQLVWLHVFWLIVRENVKTMPMFLAIYVDVTLYISSERKSQILWRKPALFWKQTKWSKQRLGHFIQSIKHVLKNWRSNCFKYGSRKFPTSFCEKIKVGA